MNSLQYGQRLTRNLIITSLSDLAAKDRTTVLDAANAGLDAYFDTLPSSRRQEEPRGSLLRAPVDHQINIIENATGFTYVSGTPWPAGGYQTEDLLVGHSVRVSGSAHLNRLKGPGELLQAYLAASGEATATFYGDAVAYGHDDRRIVQPPRYLSPTSGSMRTLQPLTEELQQTLWNAEFARVPNTIQTGEPIYWWTEPWHQGETSAAPVWMLRVWPLPIVSTVLNYTLSALPAPLGFLDFTVARELRVPDRDLPHVLALAEENLVGTTLWHKDADKREAHNTADRARLKLGRNDPFTSEPNPVGTAPGY